MAIMSLISAWKFQNDESTCVEWFLLEWFDVKKNDDVFFSLEVMTILFHEGIT